MGASVWVALQFWLDLDWFPQAAFPASTFINRNFFAEYAVSVLPLSVYLLLHVRRLAWLGPMAASVALVVVALLMTGTRSALVALWLLLAVFVVVGVRYRHQLPWQGWAVWQRTLVAAVLAVGLDDWAGGPAGGAADQYAHQRHERLCLCRAVSGNE